jgi:hypothetical protein
MAFVSVPELVVVYIHVYIRGVSGVRVANTLARPDFRPKIGREYS